MKLKRLVIISSVVLATALTACTPTQIEVFKSLDPTTQQTVIQQIRTQNQTRSVDCYQAIDKHWPATSQSWARSIVWRESRNNPTAQNRSSSAAGCFQMLSLHQKRFNKLGFSWSQRYNPDVNVLVAYDLYKEAGTSPWSL
jgi:hypothetical protein